jgi:hypothetical protein
MTDRPATPADWLGTAMELKVADACVSTTQGPQLPTHLGNVAQGVGSSQPSQGILVCLPDEIHEKR